MVAITGSCGATRFAARTASTASRRSVMVSTQTRSAPAAARIATWRSKDAATSAGSASP